MEHIIIALQIVGVIVAALIIISFTQFCILTGAACLRKKPEDSESKVLPITTKTISSTVYLAEMEIERWTLDELKQYAFDRLTDELEEHLTQSEIEQRIETLEEIHHEIV